MKTYLGKVKVYKRGLTGAGISIPSRRIEGFKLKLGDFVNVYMDDNDRIIIEKSKVEKEKQEVG